MELEAAAAALGATTAEQRRALASDARWVQAVDRVVDAADPVLRTITEVAGPHRTVLATGGWLHDHAVLAAKRRRLPGIRPTGAALEAGAAGAAYLAAVAAGLMPPPDQLAGPPWPVLLPPEPPAER